MGVCRSTEMVRSRWEVAYPLSCPTSNGRGVGSLANGLVNCGDGYSAICSWGLVIYVRPYLYLGIS